LNQDNIKNVTTRVTGEFYTTDWVGMSGTGRVREVAEDIIATTSPLQFERMEGNQVRDQSQVRPDVDPTWYPCGTHDEIIKKII
jgi:hypothetical protein